MGKIGFLHSRFGRILLTAVAVLGLILLSAMAWEILLAIALIAAMGWMGVSVWHWLDRRLRLTERFRDLSAGLKPIERPLKKILIIVLAPIAVFFFLRDFWVAAFFVGWLAALWGIGWVWKRYGKRIAESKVTKPLKDLPIQAAYVLYVVVALLCATVLCSFVQELVGNANDRISLRYEMMGEVYVLPNDGAVRMESIDEYGDIQRYVILDSNREFVQEFSIDTSQMYVTYSYDPDYEVWDGTTMLDGGANKIVIQPFYTEEDRMRSLVLDIAGFLSIPIIFVGAIVICAMLFYQRKLRRPIEILNKAAGKIAESDLDFRVEYAPRDEMGRLCDSFEKMRAALQQSNAEMWRHMEERRRLNAAFSHDLRTPLTVLKGHVELLRSGVPDGSIDREEMQQEVAAMSKHIDRLEKYVAAMSRLQRLEDLEIHAEQVKVDAFIQSMRESARILCVGKKLAFTSSPGLYWHIDSEVVMQVFENLMSNAVRYAKSQVTVKVVTDGKGLELVVSDDGKGFSSADLQKATEPFYRSDSSASEHLGLGLNICRILCERHGGGVTVRNGIAGGAEVRARFAFRD